MYYIFNETRRGSVYGVGTYIRELASTLKDSGIRVCIVHLRSDKEAVCMTEEEGVRQWFFPAPQTVNLTMTHNKQQDRYFRNIVYLLKLHIKGTQNLIFHLNFNQCTVLAGELKKAFDCRVLAMVHYSDWAITLSGNLSRLKTILAKEQPDHPGKEIRQSVENDRLLYLTVDRVVCLSQYMQHILCKEYCLNPTKISIIPNGLSDHPYKVTDRKALRKKWLLPAREKIILFAGRLDDIKGLGFLIEAFRKVVQTYPQCRLIVAGDGVYNIYMKPAIDISTKITYTGLLAKTELYELYRIADVGVVPSLYEPFGYVAVEMMMHSLPIVATATSGLNEVVDDTCALKIPVIETPEAVEIDTDLLAEKILYLLQHPKEAKRMGQNGRKRYLKHYTSEVFRKNMLEFYQSLFV